MLSKKIRTLLLASVPLLILVVPCLLVVLLEYLDNPYISLLFINEGVVAATFIAPFLWWRKKWKKLKETEQDLEIKKYIELADNFYDLFFLIILCAGISAGIALFLSIPTMHIYLIFEELLKLFGIRLDQLPRKWIIASVFSLSSLITFFFVTKFMLKRRKRIRTLLLNLEAKAESREQIEHQS